MTFDCLLILWLCGHKKIISTTLIIFEVQLFQNIYSFIDWVLSDKLKL